MKILNLEDLKLGGKSRSRRTYELSHMSLNKLINIETKIANKLKLRRSN